MVARHDRDQQLRAVVSAICAIALLALAACTASRIAGIDRGQTQGQVTELLGPPDAIKPALPEFLKRQIWIWDRQEPSGRVTRRGVLFDSEGKVVGSLEWERPAPQETKESRR